MAIINLRDAHHGTAGSVVGDVLLSVRKQGNAWLANMTVPAKLLTTIGEPKRVRLEGSPHEGFHLHAASDTAGVQVNYKTGRNVYLTFGVLRYGFKKEPRQKVELRAHTVGNTIYISGPPQEWIVGSNGFNKQEAKRVPVRVVRLSANPQSGSLAHGPTEPSESVPREAAVKGHSPAELQHQLVEALGRVRDLKQHLEAATGLRLMLTRDLRIILSEKVASA